MIDLHIIHYADTRNDPWLACLASAKAAEAMGLVTLHLMESTGENSGADRAAAYRTGNNPFVAGLDHDAVLIPEGIPALLQALADRPDVCGVYSDQAQIDASGKILFTMRRSHWTPDGQRRQQDFPHLAVYRRTAVMPHLDIIATFPVYSEYVLAGMATQVGPWWHVPVVAYQHREQVAVHPVAPDVLRRARAIVEPILLNRIKTRR